MEVINEQFEVTRRHNELGPVEYPTVVWSLLQTNLPVDVLKTVQNYLAYEAYDIRSRKIAINIGAEVNPSTLSIDQHGYLNMIISVHRSSWSTYTIDIYVDEYRMTLTTKYDFELANSSSKDVKTTDYVNGTVVSVATTKTRRNVKDSVETITTRQYANDHYFGKTVKTNDHHHQQPVPLTTILTYNSNDNLIKVEVVDDNINMSATATYSNSWTTLDIIDEGRHIVFEYPKRLNVADIDAEMTEIFLDKQLKRWD